MSICQICQNIPFHKLPVTRKATWPHQPTLAALETSSTECPLCRLIWLGYQQALRQRPVCYDQQYKDGLLRDRELPRTQVRVRGRKDQIGLIHFHVDEIGINIAIGSYKGEALADKFIRRPVHMDPASESGLRHAFQWVENCNANHARCSSPAVTKASRSGTPLPTRVLDVGEEGNHVRLLQTNGRRARYISLSYCWGTSTPCTTTLKSFPARQQGIVMETLPKTLRDAVLVTRWMGIQYLWVDALCIVQDDRRDWERESSKMGTIYANSYLTIAASNSADISLGFLTARTKPETVGLNYRLDGGQVSRLFLYPETSGPSPSYSSNHFLDQETIQRRAWTLQERSLSTRILHYGTFQMFFECRERMLAEDGDSDTPASALRMFHDTGAWDHTKELDGDYEEWTSILTDYSERKLSKRSDNFAALSGLAGVIARRSGDRYCAGIWWRALRQMLLWEMNPRISRHDAVAPKASLESDDWYAPSWSPLSINGPIEYPLIPIYPHWDDQQLAVFLDYQAEITGEDPFGSIRNARIQLRAILLPLTPTATPTTPAASPENRSPVEIGIGNGRMGGCAYPDSRTPPPARSAFALFLKKPSKGYDRPKVGAYCWHGLVVEGTGTDGHEFRRLGLVYAKPDSYVGDGDVDDLILVEAQREVFLI